MDAVGCGDGVPGRVDVSIGQHGRLGAAGGPGGEHHQGGVVGREAPDAPLDQIRLPLLFPGAEGEHRLEGMHVAFVDFDPFGVHDDDRPQLGKVGADREGLVELFLIFADEDRHVGFGQEVVDLVGRTRRIDADRHAPDQIGAELGDDPFASALAQDGDMLAGGEAERHETKTEMAGHPGIFGPVVGLPNAVFLLAQGNRAAPRLRPMQQAARQYHLGRRAGPGHLHVHGHESHLLRRL